MKTLFNYVKITTGLLKDFLTENWIIPTVLLIVVSIVFVFFRFEAYHFFNRRICLSMILLCALLISIYLNYIEKKKAFVRTETSRHLKRISLALKNLEFNIKPHPSCAVLAWSQTDLMSIMAKYMLNESMREDYGLVYSIAINVPPEHMKKTVFNEVSRNLTGNMPSESVKTIMTSLKAITNKVDDVSLSQYIFNTISFNRIVYPNKSSSGNSLLCRFPIIHHNRPIRDKLYNIIKS